MIWTVQIYVIQCVRNHSYFLNPRGVRNQKSLGNTGKTLATWQAKYMHTAIAADSKKKYSSDKIMTVLRLSSCSNPQIHCVMFKPEIDICSVLLCQVPLSYRSNHYGHLL